MPSKIVAEPPRRWSLATRLTAWYTASAFFLILAAVGFLYWALVSTLDHEDDQFLFDKADMVAQVLRDSPGNVLEISAEIERESGTRTPAPLYLRVLDADGAVIVATRNMEQLLPISRFAAATTWDGAANHAIEIESPIGAARRTFRAIAVKAADDPVRTIHAAMDRTAEEDLLFRYRCYTGAILLMSLFVCSGVGFALARHGLRPIATITEAANRVQSSTLHESIDDSVLPAELAELAGTFNQMLRRLNDSFRRLEQFSADIAHELRTPVNNLRGEAEVALSRSRTTDEYRDVLTSGLEEYGRLSGLIDSLLFLARAESPQTKVVCQPLDIGTELHTVLEYFQPEAQEAGVELVFHVSNGIIAELDRTLFQRAISNLLANGLAHTPRGGTITISAVNDAQHVRIDVRDTGSGIAQEHLPHVFDRFYRADQARTSSSGRIGLGLALVKSIVTLHGGTCSIESDPGQGTCVRLTFPAHARDPRE